MAAEVSLAEALVAAALAAEAPVQAGDISSKNTKKQRTAYMLFAVFCVIPNR